MMAKHMGRRPREEEHKALLDGVLCSQRRIAMELIESGRILWLLKQRVGVRFSSLVQQELGWTESAALRLIALHERFSNVDQAEQFAPAALYALADQSTPQAAVDAALAAAARGQVINYTQAKQFIARAHRGR